MSFTKIKGPKIAAIVTSVPLRRFDNLRDTTEFTKEEVKKVVAMAGVSSRRLADESICSSDLCIAAAEKALTLLGWERDSVDALIMVTQTPDYFLPSTCCIVHKSLRLSENCASFDVGLGCSGYPYGMWLASMMINTNGIKRVLLLHGETPSRFSDKSDRAVSLLFGDAGSATALEVADQVDSPDWFFGLYTDGQGYGDMIIEGGGFRERFCDDLRKYCVRMDGANIFNFTIKRVPDLIRETLNGAKMQMDDIDYFIFHQSNRYIMNFLSNKMKIPSERLPMTIKEYGNTGGASIPLTMTLGGLIRPSEGLLRMMLLGYGVGLSWSSALISMSPDTILDHIELKGQGGETNE
jgi:3-oxoacyl-[acyl-carrier-protein] synthase-3